ncbi:hypothetical protein MJO29_008193 [Puccinia striiformis f. sp. tritici]|uniref:Choline/ethanolaminephosphotransferase n=3 Tax=Puccinia striiformis TaxID=27350 RepID=A0A2S4V350_9BASI|nr:hypothetical protein MJO29_008193 [Puccinia striiformis f. sp. tritici]KAI9602631.1 hypothetical protein H4Q26_001922 [Puccinia striiformis f. sp. tritici PST-130]POW03959.1 hypothetical protein PSHT_11446 [Puccinia striiformis]
MFERPHFIPRNHRANLSKYKYSGEDHSIISRYVLTPYWNRLVTFVPMSVAPNLITLTGLVFVMVNFGSLVAFQPELVCSRKPSFVSKAGSLLETSEGTLLDRFKLFVGLSNFQAKCPSGWLYVSFAMGLWIYQSLDAIDGKQARRTGTSGPLGELFDHGCDALNTTLGAILASAALNLGHSWWTVASQVASLANFYLTTWEEYHTGTLFLSSFSGPVEGILLVIGVFLVTAVYGPPFWDQGILTLLGLGSIPILNNWGLDFPLNKLSLAFAICSLGSNILGSYVNVVRSNQGKKSSSAKTLLGLLPFVLQTAINLLWLHSQPTLMSRHLLPFMVYYGLSFAYLVGLLIVSHILKAPEVFPYWNVLLGWSLIGFADSYINILTFGLVKQPLFQRSEAGVVKFIWFSILLAGLVYAYFVTDVVLDVCDYCGINCLTIKKKPAGQKLGQAPQESPSKVVETTSTREKVSNIRKKTKLF